MARQPTPDILADVRAPTPADLGTVIGPAAVGFGRQEIPVDLIDDNPWQPREDYNGIEELAADIARNGLLQVPAGRRTADGRVQLQYGHRRLRAIKHLGWPTMPVDVQPAIDDHSMAVRAWVENHNRQDFTPLDQARYFKRLMDDGWTQQQIADQLGLARPTISNAVRLLKLPDDVQAEVVAAGLSARQAEALLSLVELPEEIKQRAQADWDNNTRPSNIVRDALAGASSDKTRERTLALLQRHAEPIHERPWYALELPSAGDDAGNVVARVCRQCPKIIKRDSGAWCPNRTCLAAKRKLYGLHLAYPASVASGIPIADEPFYQPTYHESFQFQDEHARAILTAAPRCRHLRLVIAQHDKYPTIKFNRVDGHPDVAVMCQKPGNQCRCLVKLQNTAPNPHRTRPAQLEKEIIQPAAAVLAQAVAHVPPGVLALLGANVNVLNDYDTAKLELSVELGKRDPMEITRRVFEWHCKEWRSPERNREIAARILALAGLPNPWAPPPMDALAIHYRLDDIQAALDEYLAPDHSPTPAWVSGQIEELDQLAQHIAQQPSEPDRQKLAGFCARLRHEALLLQSRSPRKDPS